MPPDSDARIASDAPADRLIRIYAEAERELRRLIRAAARRGAAGTAAYHGLQLRRVRAIVERLRARTLPLAPAVARGAYEPGAIAAAAVLDAPAPAFAGVHQEAVAATANALAGRLDGAARTVGRSAQDAIRRASLEEVAGGLARGDARRGVSARIRQRLADQGLTAFVDRSGRAWRLEPYARMVARTTTREAVTLGTANQMRELGEDLATISDHGTECEVCQEFEGRTYSLSGDDPRFEPIPEYPPFHPNCQHVLTPAEATFEDFEAALAAA